MKKMRDYKKRQSTECRSIYDIMAEKGPKTAKLMSNLTNVIEFKKKRLEDTEIKYRVKRKGISKSIAETDELNQFYFKELKEMQFSVREHFQWISNDYEITKLHLERQNKQLALQSIELQRREDVLKKKRKWLAKANQKNAAKNSLMYEKRKANGLLINLIVAYKKEKEKLQKKVMILEKQLIGKQDLEVQIERMKGKLNAMKHARDVASQKIEDLRKTLEGTNDDLTILESINHVVSVRERLNNVELHEARKELLEGLEELPNAGDIGVKRIEELVNPFHDVMELLYTETDIASELCSLWRKSLWECNWHPFKVITINGIPQGVMVNDAFSLHILKGHCGEEVYQDVMTAWRENNDYNSSDKNITTELWNFTESRKATLKEGISCLLEICGAQKPEAEIEISSKLKKVQS